MKSIFKFFLAIPDASGQQWFINMGKFFAGRGGDMNIATHAAALKVNAQDLFDCIESTTSNTARQVVRLLYSPKELLTMTGPEVPKAKRLAIRGNYILHLKLK
jgi:hypothetical protein